MLPFLIIVLILVGSVIGNFVSSNRVPGKHSADAQDRKA